LLHDGLVLFGNNAFLNSHFMVAPYPSVSSGSKDDFNFFHSQLQIRVECAFGMLVGRLGILRSAIPQNISLTKTIALLHALAKLHNFCIIEQGEMQSSKFANISEPLLQDEDYMMTQCLERYIAMTVNDGGVSLPTGLMDGGHHRNDMPRAVRRTREVTHTLGSTDISRDFLHIEVIESQKMRPRENAIKHKK
jgi:hypothetical protein